MAEPAAPESRSAGPALGSTADVDPYVPVSWMAVGAAASAAFLALLLGIMGVLAWRSKRPLLEEWLLVLAVLAVVFSFAARRIIRNSDGTRTGVLGGVDLPNSAWWSGLILGLGYVSYLLALEFSIQRDAKGEVQVWTDWVMKGDDESLDRAFHRTQDPAQRKNIGPTDGAKLAGRWEKDYVAFRQSDLRRLVARNEGSCRVELGGLRDWKYLPTGIECVYTATLTSPEGTFPLSIPMRGAEAGSDAGRQWQIMLYPTGYIDKERARLTPYGWLVAEIGVSGGATARSMIAVAAGPRDGRAMVLPEYGDKDPNVLKEFEPFTISIHRTRSGIVGATAALGLSPGRSVFDFTAGRLYKLPGGENPDASKDASRIENFKKAWYETGIVRAGERLRESTDTNDRIEIAEAAVIYRLPIEIPMSNAKGDAAAARGTVVFESKDPQLLADLKRLRASADPADSTDVPPVGFGTRSIPWRLMRIESDMRPITPPAPKAPPGAPPGPGG